jgi:hypothetical protein
MNKLFLNRI